MDVSVFWVLAGIATLLFQNGDSVAPLCAYCTCSQSNMICLPSKELSSTFISNQTNWLEGTTYYQPAGVNFSSCELVRVRPFPPLALKSLDLSLNRIQAIDPNAFSSLESLEELSLEQNDLTSVSLRPQQRLPALRRLRLGWNNIRSLPENFFAASEQLEVLLLHKNPLEQLNESTRRALGRFQALKELDVSYCSLTQAPADILHFLASLRKLDLTGNRLRDVPIGLEQCEHLERLVLTDNPIEVAKAFPASSSLKSLEMSLMPHLSEISDGAFSQLAVLEEVYLEKNHRLKTIGPAAFKGLTTLKNVSLHSNQLSHISEHLLDWSKLEFIDISDNPWSCECSNSWMFEKVIPQVKKTNANSLKRTKCASPYPLKGKLMADMEKNFASKNCPEGSTYVTILWILAVIFIAFGIASISYYIFVKVRSNHTFRFLNNTNDDD